METLLQQSISTTYVPAAEKVNLWKTFIKWCENQEANRFGWLGASIATHGCIATPITLFAIILSGNFFVFWIIAIAAMGASLITNLAAMPTKFTIPVFCMTLVIDVAIIFACASIGFNITAALA